MRQLLVTSLAVLVLGSGLWGCGGEEVDSSGPTPNGAPGASSAGDGAQPLTGDPSRIVAEVGSESISLAEVTMLVKAWKTGRNRDIDPNTSAAEMQKIAIDNLIEQKLILHTAVQQGMAPSETELEAALAQVKGQFPDEAALENVLKQEGMTLEQFTKGFRSDMTIRYFVQKAFLDTIQITDEAAASFYQANPQNFNRPAEVGARHILVRTDPNGGPTEDTMAKDKATAILARAQAGEDFIELAKSTSEDETTRDNGGDLGFFSSGMMVPAFDRMVFSLEIGDISELVKTQFGYHIIKVEDKRPAGLMDLEEVAPQIKDMLRQQRAGDGVTALVEKLKSEVEIKREI